MKPCTRVGDYIVEEMQARGLSPLDLAGLSGINPIVLGAVIAGEERVSLEIAEGLARAFGTSVDYWLRLQIAYDEWEVRR